MNNVSIANSEWMNIFAAGTIGILSFIGLTAYMMVVAVILRNLKTFATNSYYTFLASLAISDSILLFLYLFYAVPCMLLQRFILGDSFDIFIGAVFNVAYFACLACIATIGINRYWAVCRFETFEKRFNARNAKLFVCCMWIFGLFFGSFQALPCCPLRFYFEIYSFKYDMSCWGNQYFQWFDRLSTLFVFGITLTCYYCILVKKPGIFGSSKVSSSIANNGLSQIELNKRKRMERKLAMQFGVIIMVLIVAGLSFTIVPEFTTNWWFMLMDSVLYIIHNGCNPFIYLIFNSVLRAHFLNTYCGRTVRSSKINRAIEVQNIAVRPVKIG